MFSNTFLHFERPSSVQYLSPRSSLARNNVYRSVLCRSVNIEGRLFLIPVCRRPNVTLIPGLHFSPNALQIANYSLIYANLIARSAFHSFPPGLRTVLSQSWATTNTWTVSRSVRRAKVSEASFHHFTQSSSSRNSSSNQ